MNCQNVSLQAKKVIVGLSEQVGMFLEMFTKVITGTHTEKKCSRITISHRT